MAKIADFFGVPRRGARSRAAHQARPIPVRKMGFDFSEVPKYWFAGSPLATHFANGLNLVFPDGERFFIRSVKHFLDEIKDDPELLARCRNFFGQEGSHGHEHERAFENLESHGYQVRPWLTWYRNHAYEGIEKKVSPKMRLAITAALEHLTATLAEHGLSENSEMDLAHPVMRDLMKWHACEEIEHKSVAFDVFQRVDGRYWVRALGMIIGMIVLTFYSRSAQRMLIEQDGISRREARRMHREAIRNSPDRRLLWLGLLKYLRPGFHPDDVDNYHLAERCLERIGRLQG